jgi:hypothetical protein
MQVALTWTAPGNTGGEDITDYVIQYKLASDSAWSSFSDATSTATSATVTGLTNDVPYVFRVAAVNVIGTGAYSAESASITPTVPRTITIATQPKNDYSVGSNAAPNISVSATISDNSTIGYQWQANYYDYNTGNSGWNNLAGQTTATFALTPIEVVNTYNIYDVVYGYSLSLRCVLTGTGAMPVTTDIVRWFDITQQHYPSSYWYTSNWTSPNWGSPQTLSPALDELVYLDVYDNAYGSDTSWYTGNDVTIKLQISDNNSTWTDLYTADFRGYFSLYQYQLPANYGVKYYRVIAVSKWPYTTSNGTSSVPHSPPYQWPTNPYDVLRVTWPSAPTPTPEPTPTPTPEPTATPTPTPPPVANFTGFARVTENFGGSIGVRAWPATWSNTDNSFTITNNPNQFPTMRFSLSGNSGAITRTGPSVSALNYLGAGYNAYWSATNLGGGVLEKDGSYVYNAPASLNAGTYWVYTPGNNINNYPTNHTLTVQFANSVLTSAAPVPNGTDYVQFTPAVQVSAVGLVTSFTVYANASSGKVLFTVPAGSARSVTFADTRATGYLYNRIWDLSSGGVGCIRSIANYGNSGWYLDKAGTYSSPYNASSNTPGNANYWKNITMTLNPGDYIVDLRQPRYGGGGYTGTITIT